MTHRKTEGRRNLYSTGENILYGPKKRWGGLCKTIILNLKLRYPNPELL